MRAFGSGSATKLESTRGVFIYIVYSSMPYVILYISRDVRLFTRCICKTRRAALRIRELYRRTERSAFSGDLDVISICVLYTSRIARRQCTTIITFDIIHVKCKRICWYRKDAAKTEYIVSVN